MYSILRESELFMCRLPDMMPRRPIPPGARPSTGNCCRLHPPTGRRLRLQIMCPYTPFSRARRPQHACLRVILVWNGLLIIITPRCPPSQREPAPVTRGRPRHHLATPLHIRMAPALRSRGRPQGRPSTSQMNTGLITHNPRNIRAPRRIFTGENFIIPNNTQEPEHPDGHFEHQIPPSLLRGETLQRNLSILCLKTRISIRRLTVPHIWTVIAGTSTTAQHRVDPEASLREQIPN